MTVPLLAYNFLMLSCCKSSWKYEVADFNAANSLTIEPSLQTPNKIFMLYFFFIIIIYLFLHLFQWVL